MHSREGDGCARSAVAMKHAECNNFLSANVVFQRAVGVVAAMGFGDRDGGRRIAMAERLLDPAQLRELGDERIVGRDPGLGRKRWVRGRSASNRAGRWRALRGGKVGSRGRALARLAQRPRADAGLRADRSACAP